jgi:hypothetical protein
VACDAGPSPDAVSEGSGLGHLGGWFGALDGASRLTLTVRPSWALGKGCGLSLVDAEPGCPPNETGLGRLGGSRLNGVGTVAAGPDGTPVVWCWEECRDGEAGRGGRPSRHLRGAALASRSLVPWESDWPRRARFNGTAAATRSEGSMVLCSSISV